MNRDRELAEKYADRAVAKVGSIMGFLGMQGDSDLREAIMRQVLLAIRASRRPPPKPQRRGKMRQLDMFPKEKSR